MNNETNETVVVFNLDRVGAKKFAKATSKGVGRQLAIVLDNKIISAPTISEAIVAGSGQISGDFTFAPLLKNEYEFSSSTYSGFLPNFCLSVA